MESKYKSWEDKLKKLKEDFENELDTVRRAKADIFNEKSDKLQKLSGKFFQDDERIVISAPEIIIGNVNMGGVLNPDGKGNLIIRGNNIFLEGVGGSGTLAMRAPSISQIAEDPGIDGEEHVVCGTSKIVSQATEITIDSSTVPNGGAFLSPATTNKGSVSIRADKAISLDAVKSRDKLKERAKKVTDAWATNEGKKKLQDKTTTELAEFEQRRKEIDDLLKKREKIVNKSSDDDNAIRTDYRDLDELNIRIDELSLELAQGLYNYSKTIAKLAEGERQNKFFKKLQQDIDNINAENYKKNTNETSVSINSEKISLSSTDGDGISRTNASAGVDVNANSVRFEGIYTPQGELEETNRLSVNMRNVTVTGESKTNRQYERSELKSADYPSVGSVVIRSKDILLESTDHVLADKKYKEKGLTADGSISLRSKTINLSTVNSKDVEVDDQGKTTKATYTPEGDIRLLSKNVSVESVATKLDGGNTEETELTKGGLFKVRAENFAVSATDKEGKATGTASINAKEIAVRSLDVDPNSGEAKQVAAGGKVEVVGEEAITYGSNKAVVFSEKSATLLSTENVSVEGKSLAEVKQDKALLQLSGGKTTVSSSENTLKGKTVVKVLESPSITADNLSVSKAIKAPNITDGIMVDVKDTSPASAKSQTEEVKKPNEGAADKATGSTDADQALASQMLADLWKRRGDDMLEDN